MDKIALFKPKFRVEETLAEIKQCLELGWTGIGYKTDQFEQLWCDYTGLQNCHFLNSATAGLHLAVNIFKNELGWNEGDEVITPSITFVSTNHSILYESLVPVFSDIDESLCLDPNELMKKISKRTRAVIYVGIGGNAANFKEIVQICKQRGLILILDAAHMSGTKWVNSGDHIGREADCTVFSYQAVKNCPTSDAGAVCFRDKKFDFQARQKSWLGISSNTYDRAKKGGYKWDYEVNDLGYKYNGNSIAAAMAIVSLKYLDEDNARRRQIADLYDSAFRDNGLISPIAHDRKITSSRHLYQILVDRRNDFIKHMEDRGISCGMHYKPNNEFELYREFDGESLSMTRALSRKIVSLPMHLYLTDDEVKYIVDCANDFLP